MGGMSSPTQKKGSVKAFGTAGGELGGNCGAVSRFGNDLASRAFRSHSSCSDGVAFSV